MANRKKQPTSPLDPAGSRVRPGMRRSLLWLVRTGKVPALLIACFSGWGLYDALTSSRYDIQLVDAVGVQALTVDDVRLLAAVDAQSIWYIDTDEVSARVRQSPYVQDVRTRVVLPNKVEVSVAERKPEVRWMHNGVVFAVTWDGIVVDREQDVAPPSAEGAPPADAPPAEAVPPAEGAPADAAPAAEAPPAEGAPPPEGEPVEGAPPPDAPPAEGTPPEAAEAAPAPPSFTSEVTIVDTTPNRELAVGDHVDPDALELARRVSLRAPTELPVPINRIEWDAGLGVSLIFGDNRQAVIGRSNNLDQKLATLRYLLQDNTPFTFLDLRPSTPYYR